MRLSIGAVVFLASMASAFLVTPPASRGPRGATTTILRDSKTPMAPVDKDEGVDKDDPFDFARVIQERLKEGVLKLDDAIQSGFHQWEEEVKKKLDEKPSEENTFENAIDKMVQQIDAMFHKTFDSTIHKVEDAVQKIHVEEMVNKLDQSIHSMADKANVTMADLVSQIQQADRLPEAVADAAVSGVLHGHMTPGEHHSSSSQGAESTTVLKSQGISSSPSQTAESTTTLKYTPAAVEAKPSPEVKKPISSPPPPRRDDEDRKRKEETRNAVVDAYVRNTTTTAAKPTPKAPEKAPEASRWREEEKPTALVKPAIPPKPATPPPPPPKAAAVTPAAKGESRWRDEEAPKKTPSPPEAVTPVFLKPEVVATPIKQKATEVSQPPKPKVEPAPVVQKAVDTPKPKVEPTPVAPKAVEVSKPKVEPAPVPPKPKVEPPKPKVEPTPVVQKAVEAPKPKVEATPVAPKAVEASKPKVEPAPVPPKPKVEPPKPKVEPTPVVQKAVETPKPKVEPTPVAPKAVEASKPKVVPPTPVINEPVVKKTIEVLDRELALAPTDTLRIDETLVESSSPMTTAPQAAKELKPVESSIPVDKAAKDAAAPAAAAVAATTFTALQDLTAPAATPAPEKVAPAPAFAPAPARQTIPPKNILRPQQAAFIQSTTNVVPPRRTVEDIIAQSKMAAVEEWHKTKTAETAMTFEQQVLATEERLLDQISDAKPDDVVGGYVDLLQQVGDNNRVWESHLHDGRWELVYTSDPKSKLYAVPKLLSPFVSGFRQEVNVERKAVIYSTMFRILSWLPSIRREQRATVIPTGNRKSAQTLERASYIIGNAFRFGGRKIKSTIPFLSNVKSKPEADNTRLTEKCTYLGRHVKICQLSSPSEEDVVLAVFKRASSQETSPQVQDFSLSALRAFLGRLLKKITGLIIPDLKPKAPSARATYRAA